ncbi:MAG: putative RNase H-like nuclease [Gammaproteobacteria bacterium]|jgi:predicted RNase H-like nuclease
MNPVLLAGVDLAWKPDKYPTAIALGEHTGDGITVVEIMPAIYGAQNIVDALTGHNGLHGIAVDASLIIKNETGQRPCEKEVSKSYGSRGAACHSSNTTQYPDAASVYLSQQLDQKGFKHLSDDKFQIECYPHPAIIEIFNLSERLKYKKGRVLEKKSGQKKLASLIRSLDSNNVLQLQIPIEFDYYFDEIFIENQKGKALKSNEDALDAVICLYIAGLYAVGAEGRTFGNADSGYIWVPTGELE